MTFAPPDAQSRLNAAARAYLDVVEVEIAAHYGADWPRIPQLAQQAGVISSAVQTLLLPAVHHGIGLDAALVFGNVGTALGVHTAHLPDETFTELMGHLAQGAGNGRAHRVAAVMNWPTEGTA